MRCPADPAGGRISWYGPLMVPVDAPVPGGGYGSGCADVVVHAVTVVGER
ncbi:hypothetical protein [Micromonospora inyonensis]|nr:hypothetical protein [Micromonospora inyonensis]